jgi:hypothetical protein
MTENSQEKFVEYLAVQDRGGNTVKKFGVREFAAAKAEAAKVEGARVRNVAEWLGK